MPWTTRDKLKALVDKAVASGASLRPGAVLWTVSGPCREPFRVTWGTRDPTLRVWVDIDTPCRKCLPCLRRRSWHWQQRAILESALAHRTWMGTLTMKPERRSLVIAAAHQAAAARGEDFNAYDDATRFRALAASAGPHVTKWFKRVRERTSTSLRHVTVTEAHADGFPHWHCLVHERSTPVRKRELSGAWQHLGFSQWKLTDADPGAAAYVAKYLTKAHGGRVRASLGYGRLAPDSALRHSESVQSAHP